MNAIQQYEIEELNDFSAERFSINSIDEVNWALRKLSAFQAQKKEINELAEKEIERIKSWEKAEENKLQQSVDFFQSLLTEFAIKQRNEDEKFKKVSTPYGTVKFRKQQDKWEYNDQELLECLKQNELVGFIRIKEEVNKSELKKSATVINGVVVDSETGLKLEGVTVVPQADAIVVEVSE